MITDITVITIAIIGGLVSMKFIDTKWQYLFGVFVVSSLVPWEVKDERKISQLF